jgi:thymidylate kinase
LPAEPQVAPAVRLLIEALDRAGVRYCHWKSNARLSEPLRGESDLDLLVARTDASSFQGVAASLGYKPCAGDGTPSICHYFNLDEQSGRLVHIHAYYRIITGGTVLKDHHLPLEEMLLRGTRRIDGMPVPNQAAELVSFVVRKMLEYASPIEAILLAREGSAVGEELAWLSAGVSEAEVSRLLQEYLPDVDLELFLECCAGIASATPVRRFLLGRKLSNHLRHHRRHSRTQGGLIRGSRFLAKLRRRIERRGSSHVLLSGGAVVAVVGPDGAGKSTIVRELTAWLGACLKVRSVHAGKPPPLLATAGLRALLPLMRRLAPRYRKTAADGGGGAERLRRGRLFPLYALRAVALAHERKRLLVCAHREASAGTVVVSDRYPTAQPGVPEGPALSSLLRDRNPIYAWLARLEEKAYRTIPPPDVVLYLEVPVDLACRRNLTRDKAGSLKPTEVIRRRHALTTKLQFSGVAVHRVSTEADLEMTLRPVKEIVWNAL